MIADLISNEISNTIATELFIRDRRLNIFIAYITQTTPKDVRKNSTHCFIMKIPIKENFNKLHLIIC